MDRSRFEGLLELLDELREITDEAPVIVEGTNDEIALRAIGVQGEIYKVQCSSSVLEFCEEISLKHRQVVLFTDLDKAGREIGKTVKKYLTDKGVKVNEQIAKRIMLPLGTSQAENVAKRLERVQREINYP